MGNREGQCRVLLPHQRKIWMEAFKASMHHTSIESAERKAWQAVDICERVGAFGEVSQHSKEERSKIDKLDGLLKWIETMRSDSSSEKADKLTQFWQTIQSFDEGEIGINGLRIDLEEIVRSE